MAGALKHYKGGSTPRDWSPRGECLNAGTAMLYSRPARYFTYFQKLAIPIVEGLVIPMYAAGLAVGTIWIVSHDEQRGFNAEDVRVMTSLGNFAAHALYTSARPSGPEREREIVWTQQRCRSGRRSCEPGEKKIFA